MQTHTQTTYIFIFNRNVRGLRCLFFVCEWAKYVQISYAQGSRDGERCVARESTL